MNDKAFSDVINGLRNNTLTKLDLSNQYLDDNKIGKLINALSNNTSLTSLDLSGNNICYDNVRSLLFRTVNKNTSLKQLILKNCQIAYGVLFVITLEINKTLSSLILNGNTFDNLDITCLANALENNYTLTDLQVTCDDQSLNNSISSLLKRNRQLALQHGSHATTSVSPSSSSSSSSSSTAPANSSAQQQHNDSDNDDDTSRNSGSAQLNDISSMDCGHISITNDSTPFINLGLGVNNYLLIPAMLSLQQPKPSMVQFFGMQRLLQMFNSHPDEEEMPELEGDISLTQSVSASSQLNTSQVVSTSSSSSSSSISSSTSTLFANTKSSQTPSHDDNYDEMLKCQNIDILFDYCEKQHNMYFNNAPDNICCPLTRTILHDPAFSTITMLVYEREEILGRLPENGYEALDPITNQKFTEEDIIDKSKVGKASNNSIEEKGINIARARDAFNRIDKLIIQYLHRKIQAHKDHKDMVLLNRIVD